MSEPLVLCMFLVANILIKSSILNWIKLFLTSFLKCFLWLNWCWLWVFWLLKNLSVILDGLSIPISFSFYFQKLKSLNPLSTPSHPLLWSAWHAFLGPGLYVEVPPTCPSNSCSLCISNLGAGSGEAPSGPGSGHGILLVGSWPGVWSTPVLYDGVAAWGRWAPVEMCYKCKAHTGFWRLNMKSEDHKRSH